MDMTTNRAMANLRTMIREARANGDTSRVAHLETRLAQWKGMSHR